MAILLNPPDRPDVWIEALQRLLPTEEIRCWPDIDAADEIDYVIAWQMPVDALAGMANLQAILCLGAGTEQWQQPGVPAVPVVRLADPAMADDMAAYALAWVIRHQRRFDECESLQRRAEWAIPDFVPADEYPVGILGYGTIGSRIGRAFAELGYPVNAWTRTARDVGSAAGFAGLGQLDGFLGASAAVVSVLPATVDTIGLLDAERFAAFRAGSLFVNIGRGSVVSGEHVLVAALDTGPLEAVVLDVTEPEPLRPDSLLWQHPAVTITAHLSGITRVSKSARLVADNVARLRAGQAPFPLLERDRGY